MRTVRISTAIAILAMILSVNSTFAQRGQNHRGMNPPQGKMMMRSSDAPQWQGMHRLNLTDEQQEQITQLRTKHLNEVTPLRNELNEKRARLSTLQSVDKPNQKEMDKVIDEMAAIRAKIQKKSTAHRVAIQSVLTDEQKAIFNSNMGPRMGENGPKRGQGNSCGRYGNW